MTVASLDTPCRVSAVFDSGHAAVAELEAEHSRHQRQHWNWDGGDSGDGERVDDAIRNNRRRRNGRDGCDDRFDYVGVNGDRGCWERNGCGDDRHGDFGVCRRCWR